MKYIKKIFENPYRLFSFLAYKGCFNWLSDETYLKLMYRASLNEKLDLENPLTYNEKIQWLKLYDRKPQYTDMVDKYEVRKYIAKMIGEEYLIPIINMWDNVEDIDFSKLPNKFVLKCTHDSGGLIICKDKSKLNIEETKQKLRKYLKRNYFYVGREWPYKNVKPRIICEELLEDKDSSELRDYRFFCFNGEPKFITVDFSIVDKTKTRRNVYDLDWNLLDVRISYDQEMNYIVKPPRNLDEMIKLSKILSSNLPHARIDFYNINKTIYFGEITLYHQSGLGNISPKCFDKQMAEWLELPNTVRENVIYER